MQELHDNYQMELNSLKAQWIATKQAWKDIARDQFEKDYWLPIEDDASKYSEALRRLSETLAAAEINTR